MKFDLLSIGIESILVEILEAFKGTLSREVMTTKDFLERL